MRRAMVDYVPYIDQRGAMCFFDTLVGEAAKMERSDTEGFRAQ